MYSIMNVISKVNPEDIKISRKAIEKIEDAFCANFEKIFESRINSKGYRIYKEQLNDCLQALFEDEIKGLLSGAKKVTPAYYEEFNKKAAFAFHNHLDLSDNGTNRYGGYSINQICYEITKAAEELDPESGRIYDGTAGARLSCLAFRFCGKIRLYFSSYRDWLRRKIIQSVTDYPYETLNPSKNKYHPDSILKMNAIVQKSCGMPYKESARYISFPVSVDSHLTDDVLQNRNNRAYMSAIISRYGQAGGCSVLHFAGTGTGKTFAYIKSYAPLLGEACNCDVYITMPTTPQLGQAREIYDCDVRYSEGEIKGEGHNPNIRAYVYECVDSIPAITHDWLTGTNRPIIFIIDESHSLLTEKYRGKALKKIIAKAKEVLSAGGVVINISASVEMISATMPYNSLSGYDVICNTFRVSSKKDLTEKLQYPNYTYADCVKYGPAAGVEIVNAIPTDNVKVYYKNPEDKNMSSSLASLILTRLENGEKVIAEYNRIDQLTETKHFLEKKGYRVTVCSSMDKDSVIDKETRQCTYNNKVYNDIINHNAINFGEVDVVLTTKLLENGTTINRIIMDGKTDEEIEEIQKKVTTIFVVEKKNQLNLEAFEQFSGRIRFLHKDAVLLTTPPVEKERDKKYRPDMSFYIKKGIKRTEHLSEMLRKNLVEASRLHYIDFLGIEDMPEGLDVSGTLDAQAISETVYRAVNDFYKSIMYDKELFEKIIRDRYATRSVTFETCKKAEAEIEELHKKISEEGYKRISEAITKASTDDDVRNAYVSGYDKSSDNNVRNSLPILSEMKDNSRASYAKQVKTALAVTYALQDIEEMSSTLKTMDGEAPIKVLPESLNKDNFDKTLASAIEPDTKKKLNSVVNDSLAAGFKFLAQYKGLAEPLKNYALRYGDNDYELNTEELIAECLSRLPKMNTELRKKIEALIRTLFTSEKKMRIDRLIYTCKYISNVDLEFFAEMAAKTPSELDAITTIYENASYALNPGLIHAEDTASGATFAVITSPAVFAAMTGKDESEFKGLESWKGKRITKTRAARAYAIYVAKMQAKGFRYDSTPESAMLKILRLFASAFTFSQERTKNGDVNIILGSVRKKRPMDYDQIAHLNFTKKVRSKPNSFLMRFENEGTDHLDDLKDKIITNPFPIRCADDRCAMLVTEREKHWYIPVLATEGEKGMEYQIIGSSESTSDGRPFFTNVVDGKLSIKYVNGFSDESDYSVGKVGFAMMNAAQYEVFSRHENPDAMVLYRILKLIE